ncbi:MAG: indole-3-glycerol phosphate synthase TrpC [Planctomycetes bacterium]|nr:indole-3-glycerol phosphate synthase TrpC [Planctomycetota bacterium]
MGNILDQIIDGKFAEVQARRIKTPLSELERKVASLEKCRNFYKAVTKKNPRGLNVIAEVKKASPSAGLIRKDFDPVTIAKTYESCGADAISVLTDEKYFQGRLEYISQIKEAGVTLPILRKDFFVDEYQVYEARTAGADAILLIADALKPARLMDLLILARTLTLTSVIEVHSADSLLMLRSLADFPQPQYTVLGINNRDLTTMTVDINTTSRLAELVDNTSELIAESGIKTRRDVEKMIKVGVGAVLIGETLCKSENIAEKFNQLFG